MNVIQREPYSAKMEKFKQKINSERFKERIDLLKNVSIKRDVQLSLKTQSKLPPGNYLGKLTKQPNSINLNSENNGNSDRGDFKDQVKEFNITFNKNLSVINALKETNTNLIDQYNIITNPPADKSKSSMQPEKLGILGSLISKYKDKGYKIPDLTIKNNLFDPSTLVLENNKMDDYVKYASSLTNMDKKFKCNFEYDRDVIYLEKLAKYVNAKLAGDQMDSNSASFVDANKLKMKTIKVLIDLKKTDELEKENKQILIQNRRMTRVYEKGIMEELMRTSKSKKRGSILLKSQTGFKLKRAVTPTGEKIENKYKSGKTVKVNGMNRNLVNKSVKTLNLDSINQNSNSYYNTNNTIYSTNQATECDTQSSKRSNHTGIGLNTLYKKSNLKNSSGNNIPMNAMDDTFSINNLTTDSLRNFKIPQTKEINDTKEFLLNSGTNSVINNIRLKNTIQFTSNIRGIPHIISKAGSNINSSGISHKKVNFIDTNTQDGEVSSRSIQSSDRDGIMSTKMNETKELKDDRKLKKTIELYEKFKTKNSNINTIELKKYFVEYTNRITNPEKDYENLLPSDILRNVVDIKTKVSFVDFNETFKTFLGKEESINFKLNELRKIKELDGIISKLDYNLIKEIRKNEKLN